MITTLFKYFSFLPVLALGIALLYSKYSPIKRSLFSLDNDLDMARSQKILWIITGSYLFIFGSMSCLRYLSYHSTIADLGFYENRIWQIAFNYRFEYLINGHFSPIFLIHACFYKVFPSALTLLILQTVTIALSSIPIYLISVRNLRNNKLSLAVVVIFFLFPAVEYNNLFDFHPDHAFIPLILFCFYFLETNRNGWFFFTAVLAMLIKEPYLLAVAALGLYTMIRHRWHKTGLCISLLSIMLFFAHVKIILPHYCGGINPVIEAQGGSYSYLGSGISGMLKTLILSPLVVIKAFISLKKVLFVYVLLVPLLFIPMISPIPLACAIPPLAIQLLSAAPLHYAINNQYSASMVPFVFLSFIYGLKKLVHCNFMHQNLRKFRILQKPEIIIVGVLIVSLYFNIMTGASPFSYLFWNYKKIINPHSLNNYLVSRHDKAIQHAVDVIPDGASVCAQNSVYASRMAKRDTFYVFPYKYETADYVVLDEKRLKYVGDGINASHYDTLLQEIPRTHTIIFQKDGIYLFRKKMLFPLTPGIESSTGAKF
ncbi:MAG: DUF2079 domain-containing protein [Candidatus Kuenenia sp.]|nr:DUF2079 domain-containing protein [Candidatus Kuenenia hertensis]